MRVGTAIFGGALALALGCSSRASGSDDVVTGGDQNLDACTGGVKGWDCSKPDAMCTPKCFPQDQASRVFVSFDVSGKTLDSRAVPFLAANDLEHVLDYGCWLWSPFDNSFQGLDVFTKRVEHAGNIDRRAVYTDYVDVSIDDFHGPGSYVASPTYMPNEQAQQSGQLYFAPSGCGVEVDTDGDGGLTGTVACATLTNAAGALLSLRGTFACPGSNLGPTGSRLP